jgi:hypothetical protein
MAVAVKGASVAARSGHRSGYPSGTVISPGVYVTARRDPVERNQSSGGRPAESVRTESGLPQWLRWHVVSGVDENAAAHHLAEP